MFVQILVESNTKQYIAQSEMQKAYDYWEDVHNYFQNLAPPGLKNSFQTAMFHWSFIRTEDALQNNAYIGIGISLASSFIILLIGMQNIYVSFYTTFCIGTIFLCVMSCLPIFGWEYGTMESIMSVVILAFVVRFVFLIAYAYLGNEVEGRRDRTTLALKQCGPFIIHSSISTIGSALFIYLCVALILEKFGIIVCFTVMYSLLFSLVIFPSMLYIMGPRGDCGDIKWIFSCCFGNAARKDSSDAGTPSSGHDNSEPRKETDEVHVEKSSRKSKPVSVEKNQKSKKIEESEEDNPNSRKSSSGRKGEEIFKKAENSSNDNKDEDQVSDT